MSRSGLSAFEVARKKATKSSSVVTRYVHSSVILDRRGRIIGTGKNHFIGTILEIDEGTINKTVHSEIHALRMVDIRRLDGAIIINYSRTEVATNLSRPCANCWAVLRKLGFKKVFYSVRSDLKKPQWVEEYFS